MDPSDTVRAMYAAGIGGDLDAFLGYVHDDLVLEEPPCLPYGGIHRGKAGFLEVLAAAATFLDMSTLTVESSLSQGESVHMVITGRLRQADAAATLLEQWTVRDGQVVWGRVFWFDPTIIN